MNEQQEDFSFPELIKHRENHFIAYYDDAYYKLVSDYVTLAKRNDGDYMGVIRSGTQRRNHWLPILNAGFVSYPVISRGIRSKTATAVSTDIGLEITSTLKLPEKTAGAELAKNIYLYEEERGWTERLETLCAMLGQIGRFAAILTETDDDNAITVGCEDETAPGWLQTSDDSIGCMVCGAEYSPEQLNIDPADETDEIETGDITDEVQNSSLQVGNADPQNVPEGENLPADYPPKPTGKTYDLTGKTCLNPKCNSSKLGLTDAAQYEQGDVPTGKQSPIKAAEIRNTVISPLLIRYDDIHTVGFDWKKAHWFNFHRLETRYELISECPELKDEILSGDWSNWSESVRWHHELGKADGNLGAPNGFQSGTLTELNEVNYWFYQPVMCGGWTETNEQGWQLVKKGKVVFSIEHNESIEEACKRSFKTEDFRGLMVKTVKGKIIDVKNISFLDVWTLVGWSLSVTSHVPNGEERLIQLQDAATRVMTMVYSCVQRLSVPKMWADGRVWNRADLLDQQPGKVIMAKQDINPDDVPRGIQGSLGYLIPPPPSTLVEMFINLLISISKEESGIYDETVGNANASNQTKGGREIALNQSLGLMAPTQKAKKEGKIAWAKVVLKAWQKMPDEAFILIKGTYEEEWKATDIEAFKNLDVDRELVIQVIEGTDIPKTRPQQLENFQIAAQMGLLSPNPMLEPELQNHIVKNVLGIDFDINNLEADRRLAARRLDKMHKVCDEFAKKAGGYDKLIIVSIDPLSNAPVRALHEDILMTFAQDIGIKVYQEDNHAAYAGFYIDQRNGVIGATQPKEIDVLILDTALDMHNQMVAEKAKQQMLASAAANGEMNQLPPGAMPPEGKDPNAPPPSPNAM